MGQVFTLFGKIPNYMLTKPSRGGWFLPYLVGSSISTSSAQFSTIPIGRKYISQNKDASGILGRTILCIIEWYCMWKEILIPLVPTH